MLTGNKWLLVTLHFTLLFKVGSNLGEIESRSMIFESISKNSNGVLNAHSWIKDLYLSSKVKIHDQKRIYIH